MFSFGRVESDEIPIVGIQPVSGRQTQDDAIPASNQPSSLSPGLENVRQDHDVDRLVNQSNQLEEELKLRNKDSILRIFSNVLTCGQLSSEEAYTGLTLEKTTLNNEALEDKDFMISILSYALSQGELYSSA